MLFCCTYSLQSIVDYLSLDTPSKVLLAILGLDFPTEALQIIRDLHVPS